MKRFAWNVVACAMLGFAQASAMAASAHSGINVEHGWVRWLPANLPAAGYATIRNDSDKPVKLLSAYSADYGMTMLHRSMQKDGKDAMQTVDTLTIPAHGTVKLTPGGYHLMLMDAKHPIKPGDTVHVSLYFDNSYRFQVAWPVRPANATGP